jgi:chromosome segregation ATPase
MHGAVQAKLATLQADLSGARKEASDLRDALSQKDAHVKAAKEAEAHLARRLSHAQTSVNDHEKSAADAISKAQADAAAAERRVSAMRLTHEKALEDERAAARVEAAELAEHFQQRIADLQADLAACEAQLKVCCS